MTNYNEKLDKILSAVYLAGTENGLSRRLTDAEEIMHRKKAFINGNHVSVEAKQAITSLIKELVAEAKPEPTKYEKYNSDCLEGFNIATDEFEQNLLKALEEV